MTTFVAWVALILGIYAVTRWMKLKGDVEDLQYSASRLENQLRVIEERLGELSNSLSAFRIEYLRKAGELRFEPSMPVAEALKLHPRAKDVLAEFHLGGCAMCAIGDTETLAQAAETHGRPLEEMLARLNELLQEPVEETT
jgi:hybrid cluster-associated redox disulfide protein